MENQLQIDFGDPNDNPDVRNFVLVDGGNGDFNPKDGIIDFEISIDPPHQYLDDQALADRPSPGNDTPFDQFATAMVKDSTSNRTAMTSDFITVNNNKKWRFYEDANFKGKFIEVGGDEARNVGKFGRKISSFRAVS